MPVLPRGLHNPSLACPPRATEVEASVPRQGFQLEKDPKSPLTHTLDLCAHPNSLHGHLLCILNDLPSFKSSLGVRFFWDPDLHPLGSSGPTMTTIAKWPHNHIAQVSLQEWRAHSPATGIAPQSAFPALSSSSKREACNPRASPSPQGNLVNH